MLMSIRIFLFISLVLMVGCSKNRSMVCIDDICIDGEWNWIASSGSFAGVTITPETEMESRKVVIDENLYQEYINSELIVSKEYEFVKSTELFSTEQLLLKLDEGSWYVIRYEEDKLIVDEACPDCWVHTYEKN